MLYVDKIYGNDSTASQSGSPFLTINAAIAAATGFGTIYVQPAFYVENITIPPNLTIVGASSEKSIIGNSGATGNITVVTMGGTGSVLSDMGVKITSSSHSQLIGVNITGAGSAMAVVDGCKIYVDNGSASVGGSSNVYGILCTGNWSGSTLNYSVINTEVTVYSTGFGTKRGLQTEPFNSSFINNSIFQCSPTGSTAPGSYVGVGASTGSTCMLSFCNTAGFSADIRGETGATINMQFSTLNNYKSNLGYYVFPTENLYFSHIGTPGTGTLYFYPGNGTTATVIGIPYQNRAILRQVRITMTTGPVTAADTYEIMRNGTVIMTISVPVGTTNIISNFNQSVTYEIGDIVRVRVSNAAGTKGTNPIVLLMFAQ